MNGFALKTIAVTALVCFLADWSRAESGQDHNSGVSMSDKVASFVSNIKTGASEAYHSMQNNMKPVQEIDAKKKMEQSLSSAQSFFSDTFSKFKSVFSSKPRQQSNARNEELEQAIKAFDDYAQNTNPKH
ncbi:uncharacterized protein LOC126835732 isoform X2 [Adelges cooleyi]|uniref:uncharacterized protein LOC126835732 isoform X2 n=1 Tax=Adelges cooleyi TaxID=133065 RepID=UPI00217F708A|nr:uncharacterized protein LOC126835732 isoform X2 [Adelges cooleyi]